MKNTAIALLAVLLLAGCTDSVKKMDSVTKSSPKTEATDDTQEPAVQTAKAEPDSQAILADSPVDATVLLAATLGEATAAAEPPPRRRRSIC